MLEFPECVSLARQLREHVSGRTVRRVEAGHTPHKFAFFSGDPEGYDELLSGKVVTDARAYGGHVELTAEDACLDLSDGVSPRFHEAGEKLPDKHQLLVEFTDGTAITCTIQMYGFIQVFPLGQCDNPYSLTARGKPSPLSDAFDRTYFQGLLDNTAQNVSAKAFLATEQRIPGLGNGVLQDILFAAGIHPKTKLSALGAQDRDRLFACVKGTLKEMANKGGRDTEKDLFGRPGGYRTALSKNTLDKPCPKCGGTLVRQAYLGGNVYFCPVCQQEK